MKPVTYSFPRYLTAKRTVDDRALNRLVLDRLTREIANRFTGQPLRVLEIGMGVGTMIQRLVEWRILQRGVYTGIDAELENTTFALEMIPAWASQHGLDCTANVRGFHLSSDGIDLSCHLQAVDLFDFIRQTLPGEPYHLIIANAFFDLVDVPRTLAQIDRLLMPGSLGYFSINFDGMSILEPQIDPHLDDHILALYHRSMDERIIRGERSGDSRTGRRLFHWLQRSGWNVLAAGASDWMVHPVNGKYIEDEAYFLHFLLHFFEDSLLNHPQLDPQAFTGWLEQRREQIERSELVFIAHQLDYLAEKAG